MGTKVIVALGSNLGDRKANIMHAVAAMRPIASGAILLSSMVETEPVGMPGAPAFINAGAAFDTKMTPRQLLRSLQAIEVALGRPSDHAHHASRTIDLDIILFGEAVINEPDLVIPHPRARERDFVMTPLREIAPDRVALLDRLGAPTTRPGCA